MPIPSAAGPSPSSKCCSHQVAEEAVVPGRGRGALQVARQSVVAVKSRRGVKEFERVVAEDKRRARMGG